jgi:hypothetical protein
MSSYGEGGGGETGSYPGGADPAGGAAGPGAPPPQAPPGGYPPRPAPYLGATRVPPPGAFFEYRVRHRHPFEPKPFFLTSEFLILLVAIVALAITAGTSDSVDARWFWVFATIMIAAYILSRGIAKSARNRGWGPRGFGPGPGGPPDAPGPP